MPEPAPDRGYAVAGTATQTQSFRADRSELRAIDDWIEAVGRQWAASTRTMFAARLCVSELAANAVEHGIATAGADDRIVVTLSRCDDGIVIEFRDSRRPFDPTSHVATPPPESIYAAEIGGRGLMLVRAYSRDLAYRHDGRENRVTLKIASA